VVIVAGVQCFRDHTYAPTIGFAAIGFSAMGTADASLVHSCVQCFGGDSVALSYSKDIRQLFRDDLDVTAMKNFGLDLSSYDEVKAQAENIYSRLEDGSMPCDGAWPKEQIARFRQWIDDGSQP
jgi:hypothetical protein